MTRRHFSVAPLSALVLALGTSVAGQIPVVNVDYHKHLQLWRAQKNIATALENLNTAETEMKAATLGLHGDKARALLIEAAQEIKLAADQRSRR